MRSVTRAALVAAAAALGACGDYSTEDLRFLVALPQRQDLEVAVPAGGSPGALTVCANGSADVWRGAKDTSDGLNRGVDFLVSLIDVVRGYPPTAREENARRWGPFPAERHPGRELQIVLTRSFPPELGGAPRHAYAFQAREGSGPFRDVIAGAFEGASASRGSGTVVLDFEALWALRMNDGDDTPRGLMQVTYDRASEPVTISLTFTQEAFGLAQFGYAFTGYRDGRGAFDYRIQDGAGDVLTVATGYGATGAGRAAVEYDPSPPGGPTGSFRQCWDRSACLTYVDDPGDFSCPAHASCSFGTFPDDCPEVPVAPF
jgi:hypothetical protein